MDHNKYPLWSFFSTFFVMTLLNKLKINHDPLNLQEHFWINFILKVLRNKSIWQNTQYNIWDIVFLKKITEWGGIVQTPKWHNSQTKKLYLIQSLMVG
jgi:hypothetical protein